MNNSLLGKKVYNNVIEATYDYGACVCVCEYRICMYVSVLFIWKIICFLFSMVHPFTN